MKLFGIDPFEAEEILRREIDASKVRLCCQLLIHNSIESAREFRDLRFKNMGGYRRYSYSKTEPLISNVIARLESAPKLAVLASYNMMSLADGQHSNPIVITNKLKINQRSVWSRFYDPHDPSWVVDVKIEKIHHQGTVVLDPPEYKDATILRDKTVLVKLFVPENDERLDVVKLESEPIEFVYKPVSGLSNNDNYLNSYDDGNQFPTTSNNSILPWTSKRPFAAFNFNQNYNHDNLIYEDVTSPLNLEKIRKTSLKEN